MHKFEKNRIKCRLSRHRALGVSESQCDVAARAGAELLADCLAEASPEVKQDTQRGLLLFERDAQAITSYSMEGVQWDQIPFMASTDLSTEQIAQAGEPPYDVLVSNLAFDWVDAGGFIQLLHSLLSDDGRFWFSCFGAGTASTTRSILAELEPGSRFKDFFELQDVGDALFSAGFKDVSVSSAEFKLEYTAFEVLMADAHRIFGLKLNSGDQAVVYDRAVYRALKAQVESVIREQGVYVETIEIMIAHGYKAPEQDQSSEIPVRLG